MWIEDYKRSLKMPEAEEFFDLLFYRPAGYVLVKVIYRLPVTPNRVTLLSMITGLVSAWYFSLADVRWGAVWYALSNILDCSDGQLARLQNSGTLFGRVVDGVSDYVVSGAIFLGVGIGLSVGGAPAWWLVVVTGVSTALHAFFFDHYQGEFISAVRGEKNLVEREIENITAAIRTLQSQGGARVKTGVLQLYLLYLQLQRRPGARSRSQIFRPDAYRAGNLTMIRLWSFLGPTTNRTLLIVCALIGRTETFLWIISVVGNLWLLVCLVLQKESFRKLSAEIK